jgi:hypothetical protein
MRIDWKNLGIVTLGCVILSIIEHLIFVDPPLWTIVFYLAWGAASVPLVGPIFLRNDA